LKIVLRPNEIQIKDNPYAKAMIEKIILEHREFFESLENVHRRRVS